MYEVAVQIKRPYIFTRPYGVTIQKTVVLRTRISVPVGKAADNNANNIFFFDQSHKTAVHRYQHNNSQLTQGFETSNSCCSLTELGKTERGQG